MGEGGAKKCGMICCGCCLCCTIVIAIVLVVVYFAVFNVAATYPEEPKETTANVTFTVNAPDGRRLTDNADFMKKVAGGFLGAIGYNATEADVQKVVDDMIITESRRLSVVTGGASQVDGGTSRGRRLNDVVYTIEMLLKGLPASVAQHGFTGGWDLRDVSTITQKFKSLTNFELGNMNYGGADLTMLAYVPLLKDVGTVCATFAPKVIVEQKDKLFEFLDDFEFMGFGIAEGNIWLQLRKTGWKYSAYALGCDMKEEFKEHLAKIKEQAKSVCEMPDVTPSILAASGRTGSERYYEDFSGALEGSQLEKCPDSRQSSFGEAVTADFEHPQCKDCALPNAPTYSPGLVP